MGYNPGQGAYFGPSMSNDPASGYAGLPGSSFNLINPSSYPWGQFGASQLGGGQWNNTANPFLRWLMGFMPQQAQSPVQPFGQGHVFGLQAANTTPMQLGSAGNISSGYSVIGGGRIG